MIAIVMNLSIKILRIFEKSQSVWIDACIRYRDTIPHYRTLHKKVSFNTPLLQPPITEFVIMTYFEDKEALPFIQNIQSGFESFLQEIISLLKEQHMLT